MTQNSSQPKQREEPKNRLPAEAFEALEKLYRRVDEEISESGVECWLRGDCCDFEKVDHTLFASSLELESVREKHPETFPPNNALCPFWEDGRCVERERRPLGCRTYFCDENFAERLQAIYENYHAEIRELAKRYDIPYSYKPFVLALRT